MDIITTTGQGIARLGDAFRAIAASAVARFGMDPEEARQLCHELDECVHLTGDEDRAADIAAYLDIEGAGFMLFVPEAAA